MNLSELNIQTPYFVIHTDKIDAQIDSLVSALSKRWDRWRIGYSVKTNNLPWIVSHMKSRGIYAEVVSSDEYDLARELGYDADGIIFNGPAKRKAEFVEAVNGGATVNIDSKRELRWLTECDAGRLKKQGIGLRVNFCIEEWCPGESQCGAEDGRFGFSYESGELKGAIDFLSEHGIKLSGLHLHCSSKTRSLNIYGAISSVASKIVDEYDLTLDYVDVGGGFFGGMPGKPSFDDYFELIKTNLSKSPRTADVEIIVEPGMALVGANIDYIASVIDVKKTKNNVFVMTDGGRTHIDPLMRKTGYAYYFERIKSGNNTEDEPQTQIIGGFTCMEGDRFFTVTDKPLCEGDRIHFEKVGAYTMGMSPQFIEFYPAVYARTPDGLCEVRKKWRAKDFVN